MIPLRAIAPAGVVLALVATAGGCGARAGTTARAGQRTGTPASGSQGPALARVGDEAITADDVAATARAEGITDARRALARTIELTLLADEATRRGLDNDPLIADTARRAQVQALLFQTVETAVRPDNLPADELAMGMRVRGFERSHDELWRAAHALVKVTENASPQHRAEARTMAEEIRRRLLAHAPPRDGDVLTAIADEVCHNARHTVENLRAADAEGNTGQANPLDPAFTGALVALREPGDVSPVVQTPYGYHVIVLQQRLPAVHQPLDEVRAGVERDLLLQLRHSELEHLLAALRARYNVHVRDEAVREAEHARLEGEGAP